MHTSYDVIRELLPAELKRALDLVWTVFNEFEAPDYSSEGIQTFLDFIQYSSFQQRIVARDLTIYGCFDHKELLGVIALRKMSHISLLFVQKAFHHRGIARGLIHFAFNKCRSNESALSEVTVNSSPYAVGFYYKLGFVNTSMEQTVNGIRFTPMKYKF